MSHDDITVDIQDLVATVQFNRPPSNFFDLDLIRGLADAYQAVDADPAARAIVLCSAGKVFCAGADFAARERLAAQDAAAQPGELYREAVRLFRASTPVVAAVQGAAVGGGLGLALSADFRVASPEARFCANFVRLGLHPGFGLTVTLARAAGRANAELMLLTGRRVKGEEALAMGLVQELVPAAQLRERATGLAREIALGAPLSLDAIRASQRGDLADRVEQATARELAIQARLKQTADFREGVRAMSQRRTPRFHGE